MTQAAYKPSARASSQHATGCTCSHCGLTVPKGMVDAMRKQQFCCMACESAYEVIHGCGLDAYYRLRDKAAAEQRQAKPTDAQRLSAFDSDKFHELYVRRLDDGLCATDLLLEGVHCAACVWLIEKLPRVVPGVIEARLSLREATVRIVWDPQRAELSQIAKALGTLGYAAHPARGGDKRGVHLAEQRAMLVRLGVAGALAGNTMLLAFALYTGMFGGMEQRYAEFFRWISVGLGVLSLAWPGRVFFQGAWAALRTRSPHLDVPIALALGVGGVAGAVNVVVGRGDIYFDSLTVLVFLLLVGRFIQYRQQRRADDAVGLLFSLTPSHCRRVVHSTDGDADGESIESVPVEALGLGDLIEVRSGELLPADGVVVQGQASVIAALITGESRPVPIAVGDRVCAGARLAGATLRVRVSAVGEASRVGKLMALVQRGMSEKPPIIALTDRVAGWFVCAVSFIALVVFVAWSVSDVALAVDHTVALLIVACPCALGLATPLGLAVAMGRSARRDILIKSAAALDRLSKPGRLLIDKTGTVTRGAMRVEAWQGDMALQPLIAEAERHATHPIARAIVEAYGDQELAAAQRAMLCDIRVDRCGVSARLGQGQLRIGSRLYLLEKGIAIEVSHGKQVSDWSGLGCTTVYVAIDDRVVAMIAVGDAVHEDAKASIDQLRRWGWEVSMLTGDERAVAMQVGQAIGLDASAIAAGVSPEQKLEVVTSRLGDERAVVMVGDGVNDAAALASADVGVSVSGGAEASMAAADVYLARPGLSGLVELIATARNSRCVIRRCLCVSFSYNALAVALAAAGLINPLVAAVLMPASSALVLGLAMHGQRRPRQDLETQGATR